MSFINSILNVFVGSKSKKDLKEVEMYCPDTTLWTKKKLKKPCYLIPEQKASIINLRDFTKE